MSLWMGGLEERVEGCDKLRMENLKNTAAPSTWFSDFTLRTILLYPRLPDGQKQSKARPDEKGLPVKA